MDPIREGARKVKEILVDREDPIVNIADKCKLLAQGFPHVLDSVFCVTFSPIHSLHTTASHSVSTFKQTIGMEVR